MKLFLSKLLVLASVLSIAPFAQAEDCWDATYAVGGYNLYSFGVDMYNTYDYCAPVQPVCCDTCYDSPTLYSGYNDANISQLTQMVNTNQQLINQLYGLNPNPMQIPGITDPGFGGNPNMGPNLGNIPPLMGNPYNPYTPVNPNPFYPPVATNPYYPTNPSNPYYPSNPINPYYPTSPIAPTYPVNPSYPTNPTYPVNPSIPVPPSIPPYLANPNPGTPGNPTVSLPQNPNLNVGYQSNTNQVGQDPTRYRVPRGTRRLTH